MPKKTKKKVKKGSHMMPNGTMMKNSVMYKVMKKEGIRMTNKKHK